MTDQACQIIIDGEPAYLYQITIGAYSDQSEEWFWHRQKFTEAGLIAALLAVLPAEEAKEAERQERRNAYTREKFGCNADEVGWEYRGDKRVPKTPRGKAPDLEAWFASELCSGNWEPRRCCLESAGFVELSPTASWDTDEPWRYEPGKYEAQLRRELEEAQKLRDVP
jgi:hypothetical protein